ncbi:MAG: hypothetical protein KF791_19710 [Verrucomicrobiae bacterium]|nr:hypothetical protein [Verrucomicrobiae bacterium]
MLAGADGRPAAETAPVFGSHVGTDGSTAALRQSNGQILLSGGFTLVNGEPRRGLARLNSDGSLDAGYSPVVDGPILAWALQGGDRLLIGGAFESVNGMPRSRLARLNSDGSLDSTLANNAFDGEITAILVQSDQKLVIGGFFLTVNGVLRRGLARLQSDGAVETLFEGDVDGGVLAVLEMPNGQILIGGGFTRVNGMSRPMLARLMPGGRLDPAYAPDFGFQAFSRVFALALQHDDRLLVGGDFFGHIGGPPAAIARLTPDGGLDTSFQPDIRPTGGFDRSRVGSIVPSPDGRILVGGYFPGIEGRQRRGLARLHSGGVLDHSFDTVLEGDFLSPGADEALPSVSSILLEPGGGLVIAGSFFSVNCLRRDNIARVAGNGGFPDGTGCGGGEPPPPDPVRALAVSGWPEPPGLRIQFDAPVEAASATNPAHYAVTGKAILGVVMDGTDAVVLGVGEFDQTPRTVEVTGVRDATGETTMSPTTLPLRFDAPGLFYRLHPNTRGARVDPHYPAPQGRGRFPAGADPFRPGADGSSDAVLQGGSGLLPYFELPHAGDINRVPPADVRDHYMVVVHGLVVPSTTTDYVFFIASDDQSKLFLSPDAGSDHAVLIAEERNAGPARQWRTGLQKSAPIRLEAGREYYLEAIRAGGTGGDNLAVGWSTNLNAAAPEGGLPINGSFLRAKATTGTLLIAQDPESIEAGNQQLVAFSVEVLGSDASAVGYQWLRNGQVIPGATGWIHRFVATPDQNGDRYSVRVFNRDGTFNRLSSREAVLTVDDRPPAPGALDLTFDPGPGPDDVVRTLAATADGRLVLGGNFTRVGGIGRGRIARLLPDGNLDVAFAGGTGFDDNVWSLALDSDGAVLTGGAFANHDGTDGRFLVRLTGSGSRDSNFAPSVASTVLTIRPTDANRVLIGGGFATVGGVARNRIARLDPTGQLDASFNPGAGANDWIFAIATHPTLVGDQVYVAGDFTTFDGVDRVRFARLRPDGSLDAAFNAGANNRITSIAVQPDGKPVIAGYFTLANRISRARIARFNVNGTLDTTFLPNDGADGGILALALQPDGKLVIGGVFTSYQGFERNRIARLNPDGSLDHSFDPGLGADDEVHAVAVLSDGSIAIAGSFSTVNGFSRHRVARLLATPAAVDPPRFTSQPLLVGEGVRLAIGAGPDEEVVIVATPDLLEPGQPIHTNRGSFLFVAPLVPGWNQAFYQVLSASQAFRRTSHLSEALRSGR